MPSLSIIIPAYNEEEFLGSTLEALGRYAPPAEYEVIVVDNGSTDSTVLIAKEHGAKVILCPEGTVAAVRNEGVKHAQGSILVFIDADVLVSPSWQHELAQVIERLEQAPMVVTGSRCLPVDDQQWLNKYWFSYLNDYDAPYINTGHLITTKVLFNTVSGFTESLETAEDYDFCMKAVGAGAVLAENKALKVYHYGYPNSLRSFIKRERWHGMADASSWQAFLHSKVALIASSQLLLFLLALVALTFIPFGYVVLGYVTVSYFLCLALSLYKYGRLQGLALIYVPVIFYCYLWGRSLSLLDSTWLQLKSVFKPS